MTVRSRGALAFALAAFLVSSLSCAHDQQLVSITVQPDVETFGASNIMLSADAGLSVQLKALGNYIHPPVTKDITAQVAWASNTPDIATVDPTGLLTATGLACGNALVSATVKTNSSAGNRSSSGAIVTGFMTATVVCFTGSGPGGSPILTVTLAGAGTGIVSSSPAGIICPSACSASFPSGTSVILTAAPTGSSTFGSWSSGCSSISGNTCTVVLNGNTTITATFN